MSELQNDLSTTENGQPQGLVPSRDATRIVDGIEWFTLPGERGEDCQCARCGSSGGFRQCGNCDEFGFSHHDCGEDSCCCLHPENDVVCEWCDGTGGSWHCISSPEWCAANPLPGREHIDSTALTSHAWGDL